MTFDGIFLAQFGGGNSQTQSPIFMIGWLVLMLFVFYFLMIRPQQRREKERRAQIDNIKSGERVVFAGGLIGVVTNVKDKTFMIRIADTVKVEVARAAVTQVLAKDEDPDVAPAK